MFGNVWLFFDCGSLIIEFSGIFLMIEPYAEGIARERNRSCASCASWSTLWSCLAIAFCERGHHRSRVSLAHLGIVCQAVHHPEACHQINEVKGAPIQLLSTVRFPTQERSDRRIVEGAGRASILHPPLASRKSRSVARGFHFAQCPVHLITSRSLTRSAQRDANENIHQETAASNATTCNTMMVQRICLGVVAQAMLAACSLPSGQRQIVHRNCGACLNPHCGQGLRIVEIKMTARHAIV
jgi:hypothetical protein